MVYDADCGICTRFKRTLDFLDAHRNLDFMSIDHAEEIGLLDALSDAERHRSFHLILMNRGLESGAEALPTLIRLLPAGRFVSKMIVSTPWGRNVLNFLYTRVARLHEVGSCKMQSITHSSVLGEILEEFEQNTDQNTDQKGSELFSRIQNIKMLSLRPRQPSP